MSLLSNFFHFLVSKGDLICATVKIGINRPHCRLVINPFMGICIPIIFASPCGVAWMTVPHLPFYKQTENKSNSWKPGNMRQISSIPSWETLFFLGDNDFMIRIETGDRTKAARISTEFHVPK